MCSAPMRGGLKLGDRQPTFDTSIHPPPRRPQVGVAKSYAGGGRHRGSLKREETIAPLVNGYTLTGYPDVLATRCQPVLEAAATSRAMGVSCGGGGGGGPVGAGAPTVATNSKPVPLYVDLYRQNSKLAAVARDICNEK